jgi:transposase InsO family protein
MESSRSARVADRPLDLPRPAAKRRDSARLSARARPDAKLKIEVRRVFGEGFRVYGVRKIWRQLKREGFDVARCTVSRLMRHMGLRGIIRGETVKTTISNKAAPCPLDHVNRQFKAPRPNVPLALGSRNTNSFLLMTAIRQALLPAFSSPGSFWVAH